MGGAQTFATTLTNLDKFATSAGGTAAASAAAAMRRTEDDLRRRVRRSGSVQQQIKVLFLSIGSVEGPGTKAFSDALNQAGVHTVYFESPGTAHEWLSWRRAFNDFAPRLFK